MHSNTTRTRRAALTATAIVAGAAATLGFASVSSASTAPSGDDPYCAAHLDAEAAVSSEDPTQIGPAFEALLAAAPPELAPAVQAVIDNADAGPTDPVFAEAYVQLTDYLKTNCGFTAVDVLATEYAFGGIPEELPAGPAVFSLTNDGEEVHELLIVRRNEGSTAPVEELIAMPEEEAFAEVTFVAAALAVPGSVSQAVAELAPGEYIALCFIPEGTTAEAFEMMMAAPEGSAPPGSPAMAPPDASMAPPDASMAPMGSEPMPHAALGMTAEFTVTDGAAAPATTG